MAARRVSHHEGAIGVAAKLGTASQGECDGAFYIVEGSRPSSTGFADPPVFDVGRGEALVPERDTEMAGVHQTSPLTPEATMNHDYQRPRIPPCRPPEIDELRSMLPVRQPRFGVGRRNLHQSGGHALQDNMA